MNHAEKIFILDKKLSFLEAETAFLRAECEHLQAWIEWEEACAAVFPARKKFEATKKKLLEAQAELDLFPEEARHVI